MLLVHIRSVSLSDSSLEHHNELFPQKSKKTELSSFAYLGLLVLSKAMWQNIGKELNCIDSNNQTWHNFNIIYIVTCRFLIAITAHSSLLYWRTT